MTRMTTFAFIAVVLLAGDAVAQSRPDFSGRWTSEPEAAAPARGGRQGGTRQTGVAQPRRPRAGDMGSGWGTNITIAQDANRLTVEYAFFTRNDMQPPLKFVYALDGLETNNSVMMGRGTQEQAATTAWDGDKLVITTAHEFDDPASSKPIKIEVKQTLSLESPERLLVETSRSGALGGPSSTIRTVYQKR
jgi:hypothetical protein